LHTLAKEREEMAKILSIVESLMQMHIKALKELGVDLEQQASDLSEAANIQAEPKGTDKKIDELL
jgi:biotin operon repressor